MFLYVAFCITPGRRHQASLRFFLGIKCFLWIFKVSPRAIVQVRIYLWQLSYSTQCIYVASDLEMLFSCLSFVEWETNREKTIARQRRRSYRNTPTDCVIAMDQWELKGCLGAKTNSPESFGELYRTAETNSKQTSFRPDFVRNYVISVHSSISFWSISRPLGHGYSKVTKVIHCVFSGSDVGSKWQLLCSLLHSTTKHLNH